MPTVFTHALAGAVLGQAAPQGSSRWKVLTVLAALAVIPDLDVIAFSLGIPYGHFFGHRGFSHSIVFAGAMSFLTCLIFFREPSRLCFPRRRLYLVAFLASVSHGLLDASTDAGLGVGLIMPFNNERIFFEFRPLRTSAINLFAFLHHRSLSVLQSEIVWVWIPLISITVLYQAGKYFYNGKDKGVPRENR